MSHAPIDDSLYAVMVNGDDRHALWPLGHDVLPGWRLTGFTGTRQECVRFIDEAWEDAHPAGKRPVPAGAPA